MTTEQLPVGGSPESSDEQNEARGNMYLPSLDEARFGRSAAARSVFPSRMQIWILRNLRLSETDLSHSLLSGSGTSEPRLRLLPPQSPLILTSREQNFLLLGLVSFAITLLYRFALET